MASIAVAIAGLLVTIPGVAAAEQHSACTEAALDAIRTDGQVNFACSDDLLTLNVNRGSTERIVNTDTGESVNVTGISERKRDQKKQRITSSEAELVPMDGTIPGPYRGRTTDTIHYGTIVDGDVIFESSIFLRTSISLNARNHPLEVYWSENSGRYITFSVPIDMYKDISFAPDPERYSRG